jgi:hypothetical protein
MSIVRAVFERGIEVRILPSGWVVSSAESSFKPFDSLERASSFLRPYRPVLFTETREKAPDQTYLLRLDGRQRFLASLAFDTRHFPAGEIFMARHLAYLLIAMGYHCRALAEHYARISTAFAQITQIPGYSSTDGPGHFSFHPEPFFEFEALIGAARRSLDAARYPLWRKFSPHKGSTPRSLQALLANRSSDPQRPSRSSAAHLGSVRHPAHQLPRLHTPLRPDGPRNGFCRDESSLIRDMGHHSTHPRQS